MQLSVAAGRVNRLPCLQWIIAAAFAAGAPAHADSSFVQNGRAGFVVSEIKYVLAEDAAKTGACPDGMSRNVEEIFARTPQGKRRKGESDEQYAKRLGEGSKQVSTAPNGQNLCMNPEAGAPDPSFHTVRATRIPAGGIDIDGEHGIQNQFSRVVGCTRSWQSTGLSNGFGTEMLTGAWGILITIDGVDDLRNDDEVEVGIVSNADPIQLSPNRTPLSYATYAIDQDARFRAKTKGHIKDGVLTTEPVDVRFHSITNSLRLERPLLHARLQATISKDGVVNGYLAGYTPVEAMYDYQFGYRSGKNAKGELGPLPLRLGTGNGAARVLGYTCPGVYFALYEYADGDLDPQSGRHTSISTQYSFSAIPAFVVDVATESVNDELTGKQKSHEK
jgi:hypothetical protein